MDHSYADKYSLAENLTHTATASVLSCLTNLGVGPEVLQTLIEWGRTRAVSLRFECVTTCSFDREEQRQEEDPNKNVTKVLGVSFTSKVVCNESQYTQQRCG